MAGNIKNGHERGLRERARHLDATDPLRAFRDEFLIPQGPGGKEALYFCGNSLGLQSRGIREVIERELTAWQRHGVLGHHRADPPWFSYHEQLAGPMAEIVGALPTETVVMNTLTVNLHLMLVSFYRPVPGRHKILVEYSCFPSDRYALDSQIRFHGYNPDDALIALEPAPGKVHLSEEDITEAFRRHGREIALVLVGSVNYYTGQAYPLKRMSELARSCGCNIGFDLAHGAGNLLLHLHDDGPDFAVWCGYKYLNGGPGTLAGCFVHDRHRENFSLPRFAGWWGHDKRRRFLMEPQLSLIPGAEGWQLSNPPILPMACLLESLRLICQAGMPLIRTKNLALGNLLIEGLQGLADERIEILTPAREDERGAQLSIRIAGVGKKIFDGLSFRGIVADWREPDVIRLAPVALYNRFEDIAQLVDIIQELLYENR